MGVSKVIALVAALLSISWPAAVHADVIVLRSSGPSAQQIRPGSRLREGARVQLKRGDRLLLLDARGTVQVAGARTYVVGSRSVPQRQVSQALVRNAVGGLRNGLDAVAANAVTTLITQAGEASRRGDFAASNALLRRIETEWDFEHRAECRLVDNLALFNLIAEQKPLPRPIQDRCADDRVAPGTEQLLRQLETERRQLIQAANLRR